MTPQAVERSRPLLDEAHERSELEKTWRVAPGPLSWLRSVSHLDIGRRYLITAFAFLVVAGLLALVMRLQLSGPGRQLVGPDRYDQIFTLHGTTMMFLFAVPVMEGLGIYLVPLMVGTRNVAFPRLNAFGYYVYVLAGIMLWCAFLLNVGPDTGWFSYVPLSGPEYAPGKRVDFWAQLITMTEIAALVAAVEIIVTAFKQRAPGMTLDRIPLFVWSMVVTSFLVLFSMPAVMLASTYLALDRLVGTHLFNPAEGGDALLYQHLFWFFGHPEVYIIFVPALGIVSSIVATFCRRPVVGYPVMVLSLVATGFISFGLWVHHMFTTGLPQIGQSFFTAASLLIAVPSGIQIFCWIATIFVGRPVLRTPLLFVLGFIATFVLGGLTGVMLGSVPLNQQAHDSYFVVAHFHYVLIGGAVFPLLGGLYYWFPKWTGRHLGERLGRWNFALVFIGFHWTFFPMHWLGLDGMPRRIYTYAAETGWGDLNLVASLGSGVLGLGFLLLLVNVCWSLRRGARAGDDPWAADTLEWSTSSPPPCYGFLRPPVVTAREGRWAPDFGRAQVTGLDPRRHEVLATHPIHAEPELRAVLPGPSLWPFATAVCVVATFAGCIFTPWAIVVGAVPITVTLLGWPIRPGEEASGRPEADPVLTAAEPIP